MQLSCPKIADTLIVTDDARLAAHASCLFAARGFYLPIVDGPRMQRPDRAAEVARRVNAALRAKPRRLILAGLLEEASEAIRSRLPKSRTAKRVNNAADLDLLAGDDRRDHTGPALEWGNDHMAAGVLIALRTNRQIVCRNCARRRPTVHRDLSHLVVCEGGDDLVQVIAANYAYRWAQICI